MGFLARLDAFATDEPGFNEGHPEDRCPLCGRPVVDHPGQTLGDPPPWRAQATWPHRRHALLAILLNR